MRNDIVPTIIGMYNLSRVYKARWRTDGSAGDSPIAPWYDDLRWPRGMESRQASGSL
jgi:hypothetical protein